MDRLSEASLKFLTSSVNLEGTGKKFKTPVLFKFCEAFVPTLMRSFTNIHFKGLENVPMNGAVIFSGNHLSNLDPFIKILASQRPIHFLAKEGHFQKQPNRFIMKNTGQIETFRKSGGKDALARAFDVLDQGLCLGIFPEGTRSRKNSPPYLQNGKTGIARIAARFPKVPVVPICINGSREVMPPGKTLLRFWKRVNVTVGNPITFEDWIMNENGGDMDNEKITQILTLDEERRDEIFRKLYRKFTNQLMETIRLMGAP